MVATYMRCKSSPDRAITTRSGNKRRGGGRVVFERWCDLLLRLVVAGKAVNTGLNQDQTELRVLVFPVGLEMLANSNSLLHEVPEILGNAGSESYIRISGCQPVIPCQGH